MKNETNRSKRLWYIYILISAAAWLILLALKAFKVVRMNWIVAVLGCLWVPELVMVAMYALAGIFIILGRASKKNQDWRRRRKTARTLWEAMEGLTLNNIGPIYGIKRQPGEKNQSYKRRILKAARTLDTVNIQNAPTPATGQQLDEIAKKHKLQRYPHETDEQLQNRIRDAIFKELEGGRVNGRV